MILECVLSRWPGAAGKGAPIIYTRGFGFDLVRGNIPVATENLAKKKGPTSDITKPHFKLTAVKSPATSD